MLSTENELKASDVVNIVVSFQRVYR